MEGKQLEPRTPQEERDHKQRENLLTAISKLTAIGKQFERPECWEGRQTRKTEQNSEVSRYYTFAELLSRQSEGQQPRAFARRKVEALEQRLKEVRELTIPDHYECHPAYRYAEQYISYLLNVRDEIGNHQPGTTSLSDTNRNKYPGCPSTTKHFAAYFKNTEEREKVLAVLRQHHESGEAAPAARIIQAAQSLGYFPNNVKAAPLYRALNKELGGLASVEAFRRAFNNQADPNEISRYKTEIENAQP